MTYLYSHCKVCTWVIALAVALSAGVLHAATDTVPYYMDFDGVTDLSTAAGVNPSATGAQMDDTSTYLDGLGDDEAVKLNQGGFTISLTDGDEDPTNVFVQAYMKAVECTVVPSNAVGTEAGAVCVVNGTLHAYNTNAWVDTGYSVPANQWFGIAAHIDYAASNWNLYVTSDNDGEFKKNMVKAGGPYGFNTDSTDSGKLTTVTVTNEAAENAYVDVIAVNRSRDACVAGDTNLVIFLRKAGETRSTTIPPNTYSPSKIMADGTTQTALGLDMALGLTDGDKIHVPLGSGNYQVYTDDGEEWAGGYGSPADVGAGTGILLERAAGEDVLAFYPFDVAAAPQITVPLAGTGSDYKGQTDAALPANYQGGCIDINDGDMKSMGQSNGDMILFYRAELYPPARQFYWYDADGGDPANGNWLIDGRVVAFEVCPGDEFMFYNRSSGQLNWTVN